jgi:hypothetical protein
LVFADSDFTTVKTGSNRCPVIFRFQFCDDSLRVAPRIPAVFHFMNEGRTVFAQRLDFLPQYEFDQRVAAISTSPAGIAATHAALSWSPAPNKTSAAPAITPARWAKPPACVLTSLNAHHDDPVLLRRIAQSGAPPNLDRYRRLFARRYFEKTSASGGSCDTILQILSLTLFEKMSISQALSQLSLPSSPADTQNHQCLLDF